MAAQNRNDPCACGSGLKYKRCHLPKEQLATAEAARAAAVEREAAAKEPRLAIPRSIPISGDPDDEALEWRPTYRKEHELAARVRETLSFLQRRGVRRRRRDAAEDEQAEFAFACHERWLAVATNDPELVDAREAILAAAEEEFEHEYAEGLRERQRALRQPLSTLQAAGEQAVPHLAILMTDHDCEWPGILAVELLAQMPSGPLRDRALAEALFLTGDWAADTSVQHLPAASAVSKWNAFEHVARQAARDDLHIHGTFWIPLFELDRKDPDQPLVPTPDLGRAMELLYDLGHTSALAGIETRLDPLFDSIEGIRAFLDDPGVQAALKSISERGQGTLLGAAVTPAA